MKKTLFIALCWIALFIPSLILCVIAIPATESGTMPAYGIIPMLGIPTVLSYLLAKKKFPNTSAKGEIAESMHEQQKKPKKCKLTHIGGLPLPENAKCKIVYNRDLITFTANGQDFSLAADKLVDVSVMTAKEIQKQYVSSIGGAIAGAMLLGPLGAIIGGSASQKKITNRKKYLVITYQSNDEVKYILLDGDKPAANTFVSTFKYLRKQDNLKIEL